MQILRNSIELHDIRIYAYHGVLPQERKVGGWYRVSLDIDYPFLEALESDSIADTLNYADVLAIIKREMAIPGNLLEHVAGRICKAIFEEFPLTDEISFSLTKECPPMGGNADGAMVKLKVKNEK